MHRHRLRYIVAGLLIYIQSAFARTCGSDFVDVASNTIRAGVVFEGSVRERHETFSRDGRYNATMKVKRVLKGSMPYITGSDRYKTILLGTFGREDRENCTYDIGTDTYLFFLDGHNASSLDPNVPFYKMCAFPAASTKTNKKTVRKYQCDGCARSPKARVNPKEVEVDLGKKISLKCKASGRPYPVIHWYKDSQLLEQNDRIRIKTSKRSSRLKISKVREEDQGIYTCQVRNVLGSNRREVEVGVRNETVPPDHLENCSETDYCLNGGTCWKVKYIGTKLCECKTGFTGFRCRDRDLFDVLGRTDMLETRQLDRALTGTALGIVVLVLVVLVIVAYILSKKKREEFEKKKKRKEKATQEALCSNAVNGTYSNCPMPSEAEIAAETRKLKLRAKNTQHQSTQTEEMMNAPFLGIAAVKRAASSPSGVSPYSQMLGQLPRQHTAPSLIHTSAEFSQPPPRGRLSAVSATPDMDEQRRQPNMTVVNAVVESDPEQHSKRSSPSQSSKTESAHIDQNPELKLANYYPDDSTDLDLGSKGDLSVDLDQHSDYDNQPPSDLEVNLESEADVQGLDASGDEVDCHGRQGLLAPHDVTDSSDSDSDDSSSIGEEKALFHQLQSNPRVRHMPQNANFGMDLGPDLGPDLSGLSSNLGGSLPWEVDPYQRDQHPPSFAFGTYALDNDILANRYFHDSAAPGRVTGRMDDYDSELPYDPDPDATVV